jgi:hypothetical protein
MILTTSRDHLTDWGTRAGERSTAPLFMTADPADGHQADPGAVTPVA